MLEHIPLTQVESLEQAKPEGATTVVIELVEGATPLPEFNTLKTHFMCLALKMARSVKTC